MSPLKLYLCGPIFGCTDEQCKDWREDAKKRFPNAIDPMRRDYRGKELSDVSALVQGDIADINQSDALLVNAPAPSWGTAMEIRYAFERGKTIVIVVPQDVKLSPWLVFHSDQICTTFEKAYEWLERNL